MSNPLVSVIVGVYNKERYVGDCLRSVVRQTQADFELIVIDDASTDGSLAEIEKVQDRRIRLIRLTANTGHPGKVRNHGMRASRGKYLAFLDADDEWTPDKLEKQVAYMEAHPELAFTHTQCMVMDADGKDQRLRHGGHYPPAGDCFAELMAHLFICTSTVMIRRTLLGATGLFSEHANYASGQDYEFFLRCARVSPIGMPAGVLGRYRSFPGTWSRTQGRWQTMPRNFRLHRLFWRQRDLWEGKMDEAAVVEIANRAAEESFDFWFRKNMPRRAAWFAWQMVRLKPAAAAGWRHLGTLIARRPPPGRPDQGD